MIDMILPFIAPVLDGGLNRHHRGIAERTNCPAQDIAADIFDLLYIARLSLSSFDPVDHLLEPAGAFAAGRALPARFMFEEMNQLLNGPDDTGVFVKYNHGARSEHRAGSGERFIIQLDIDHVGQKERRRGSAGDNTFEFLPVGDSAAVSGIIYELLEIEAELYFVIARPIDMPGQ